MKMKVLKGLAVAMLTGIAMSVPVFAAPITLPDGTVFDPEYYAQQNPDVTAALGTDAVVLYQHYVMFGKNEGRQPYAGTTSNNTATNADGKMTLPDGTVFDPVYYAQNNPDVTAVLGTDATLLAQHYLQFGKAEGRKPAGSGSGASNANAANTANNMLVTWTCKTAQQREQA